MHTLHSIEILQVIHEGTHARILRVRSPEQGEVVVKVLRADDPSVEVLARFRTECEHARLASGAGGAAQVLDLAMLGGRPALVFAVAPSTTLCALLANGAPALDDGLRIAEALVDALVSVHDCGLAHLRLQPSHVLWDEEDGSCQLLDFGRATTASRVRADPQGIDPAHLPYLAPEQTGRLEHDVDARADLYALGVILYQLFSGSLPLVSREPLEQMHLHLAVEPRPLCDLDAGVPPLLSALVARLLAKNPDGRYQRAASVQSDLAECVHRLHSPDADVEDFVLGRADVPDTLAFPRALYGRAHQLEQLRALGERLALAPPRLLLLRGPEGSGKTALARAMPGAVDTQGWFVEGGGTGSSSQVPYAGVVAALSQLLAHLARLSDDALAPVQRRIQDAVGAGMPLLWELLPGAASILSPTAAAPEPARDAPVESAGFRVELVLERFLAAIAHAERPVLIFLDDVDRMGPESLRLVARLARTPSCRHVLFIAAIADDTSAPARALATLAEELQSDSPASEPAAHVLDVPLLAPREVQALIAATLGWTAAQAHELARICHDHTGGNPAAVKHFLESLHNDGALRPRPGVGWHCDLERARSLSLPNSQLQRLLARFEELPERARSALGFASVIGARGELEALERVCDVDVASLVGHLQPALDAGLIMFLEPVELHTGEAGKAVSGRGWRFCHEATREHIHAALPSATRERIHVLLGVTLLTDAPERVYEAADHLCAGSSALAGTEVRRLAREALLAAGRKAKSVGAYQSARRYLTTALEQLSPDAWNVAHEHSFGLHQEALEALYLAHDEDAASAVAAVILERARSALERVAVYEIQIPYWSSQGDLTAAVACGLKALEQLGVEIRPGPGDRDVQEAARKLRAQIGERTVRDLADLPEMTDPRSLAIMRILGTMSSPAYMTDARLSLLVYMEQVRVTLADGNCAYSPIGYGGYAVVLVLVFEDVQRGAALGQLALDLLPRYGVQFHVKTAMFVAALVLHWTRHLQETLPLLRRALALGLSTGELEYASYAAAALGVHSIMCGRDLPAVSETLLDSHAQIRPHNLAVAHWDLTLMQQVVRNLIGRDPGRGRLIGESYDERETLATLRAAHNQAGQAMFHVFRTMLAVVFRDHAAEALTIAEASGESVRRHPGQRLSFDQNFYQSLCFLGAARTAEPVERARLMARVEVNQRRLRTWAEHAPMNALHRLQLIEAERLRTEGLGVGAQAHYNMAIESVSRTNYLHDQALIFELTGEFYSESGITWAARAALLDARRAYRGWGARAKVADLEDRYPTVFVASESASLDAETAGDLHRGDLLDAMSLLKTVQAIAGEVRLGPLLERLVRVAVEAAGAQRGLFIVERDGDYVVEVEQHAALALVATHASASFCAPVVRYVARTGDVEVLADASKVGPYVWDSYVAAARARSILCLPLVSQGALVAILYLENGLVAGAFTPARVEVIRILAGHAALAVQNAQLYSRVEEHNRVLEETVARRTESLHEKQREQAETLAQLTAAQARLEQVDRVRRQFVENISHELRTPLALIAAPLHELQRGQPAPEQTRWLQLIDRNVVRLRHLVEQLLYMALLDSDGLPLHARRGRFNRFVARCLERFRAEAERLAVTLEVCVDDEALELWFDPDLLETVFANLVGNALRHTPEGGRMTVVVCRPPSPFEGEAEVRVEDTGPGVPLDRREHIFERFVQGGDGAARGSAGIGLALARELVQLHGGDIRVEDSPAGGACFAFTIPAGSAHLGVDEVSLQGAGAMDFESSPALVTDDSGPEARPVILIVEDHPDMRAYLAERIAEHWRVRTADSGRAALDILAEERPAAVLSDVMMPNINGMQLCQAMRDDPDLASIPVLLLSAKASDESRLDGLALADDFMTKPFHMPEVIARLGKLVTRARAPQEADSVEGNPGGDDRARFEDSLSDADRYFVAQIDELIEARLGDGQFTAGDLARSVGLSRRQLHRRMTNLVGAAPSVYLREARLRAAKRSLSRGTYGTVSEVAASVGLRPAYFSRLYATWAGHAPSQVLRRSLQIDRAGRQSSTGRRKS